MFGCNMTNNNKNQKVLNLKNLDNYTYDIETKIDEYCCTIANSTRFSSTLSIKTQKTNSEEDEYQFKLFPFLCIYYLKKITISFSSFQNNRQFNLILLSYQLMCQ